MNFQPCPRVTLNSEVSLSQIVHGSWKLLEASFSNEQLFAFIKQLVDRGITSFDHADIYGDYACEKKFGDALSLQSSLRKQIQLITKCGIAPPSKHFPDRTFKYYDYSEKHIMFSVEQSLQHFRTDYIDILLLHRPSPFMDYEATAETLHELQQQGKVLHVGVSNFTPQQYQSLDQYYTSPLVTNQIQISAYHSDSFLDGTIEFLQQKRIRPMAWSPLASGKLAKQEHDQNDEKQKRLLEALQSVGDQLNISSLDKVALAWLFSHPARIIPVLGTCKLAHIEQAIHAIEYRLNDEQWLRILVASLGKKLP